MKRLYGIRKNMQIGALLLIILGLTFWNNFEERRQWKALESNFESIYNDRLMAESYLFEISEKLHEKSMLFLSGKETKEGVAFVNKHRIIDASINRIMHDYEKTKLTEREVILYTNFKQELELSRKYEYEEGSAAEASLKAWAQLNALSHLQVVEGERIIKKAKQIFLQRKASSQFEIAILVIAAILIQFLFFSSQTVEKTIDEKLHPN